jgi:nucleoid-associated protein YgaU
MMDRFRALVFIALVGCDGAALYVLRAAPMRAARGIGAAHAWFATAGADRAIATLAAAALWLVAGWLGAGMACCLVARLPGAVGATAGAAGRAVLPRLVLRLVAGSVGLGVLVAPVAAGAHPPPRPAPVSSAAPTVPGPAWPSEPAAPTVPGPSWPSHQPANHPPPAPRPAAHDRSAETVRVRPGDSLWLLAARRLGPHADAEQIGAEWPRWYAANRAVIGPDPDLIVPGQVLHTPAASQQEGQPA